MAKNFPISPLWRPHAKLGMPSGSSLVCPLWKLILGSGFMRKTAVGPIRPGLRALSPLPTPPLGCTSRSSLKPRLKAIWGQWMPWGKYQCLCSLSILQLCFPEIWFSPLFSHRLKHPLKIWHNFRSLHIQPATLLTWRYVGITPSSLAQQHHKSWGPFP